MSVFLQQQTVKNDTRRKKVFKKFFLRVRQISIVLIVWSLFVGLIYGLYQLVFERGIFLVKNIEVDGQMLHLTDAQIRELSGVKFGANLFAVDLKKVRQNVGGYPWVKEVAVARKLPSTIWIYVGEYTPYAVLVSDDNYMVDAAGKTFKSLSSGDEKNLPVITGVSKDEDVNVAIELLKTFSASQLADFFTPAEVNIDETKGYSIVLLENGMLVKLGFEGAAEKLKRLYSMLGAIESGKGKIRYIDLNIPGKVVVKYES